MLDQSTKCGPTHPYPAAAAVTNALQLCQCCLEGAWDHSVRHLHGTTKCFVTAVILSDSTSGLTFNFLFNLINTEKQVSPLLNLHGKAEAQNHAICHYRGKICSVLIAMQYRSSAGLTALLKFYHYLSKPLLIKRDLPAQSNCFEMYCTGT